MKYKVEIKEILSRVVEVEAGTKLSAIDKVEEQYNCGDIVLDYDDYEDTEFTIVNDD